MEALITALESLRGNAEVAIQETTESRLLDSWQFLSVQC